MMLVQFPVPVTDMSYDLLMKQPGWTGFITSTLEGNSTKVGGRCLVYQATIKNKGGCILAVIH